MQRDLPSHNTAKKRKGKLWLEGWPSVSRRGSNSPFLELRDSVCVTARCLRDCGRKASDSLSLMFNSAGGKASVQNAALALCSAEPVEEGTEITPPFPWHCVFYSSAETATALLLNLSPYGHQNSLKRQRNTSKRINCIRQYFSLSNHLPYVHSLQYVS